MVSLTPHRDAVEQGLADMKARFDAGGTRSTRRFRPSRTSRSR